jgi:hypothetical protein
MVTGRSSPPRGISRPSGPGPKALGRKPRGSRVARGLTTGTRRPLARPPPYLSFIPNGKSVNMPPRFFARGDNMDDTGRYARFATHLNAKKAGPLVCPICKATETFEAKGTLSGPPSNPLTSTDLPVPAEPLTPTDHPTSANAQFYYATCTNCGYSIFFDTGISDLPE